MIRIAICDDRLDQLEYIQALCETYLSEHANIEATISAFPNPMNFLDKQEKIGGFDIVLLDICMPGMSGISVAKEIRAKSVKTEIIFLTTSDEFAMEAFAVKALHYILKPFTKPELYDALDKAIKVLCAPAARKMHLYGENGTIYTLEVNKLIYVESLRNCRTFHAVGGTYNETKRSLQVILDELNKLYPDQFISPYRGYIINLNAISSLDPTGITLKDKTVIPLKSGTFRKIRDLYFEWSFHKEG